MEIKKQMIKYMIDNIHSFIALAEKKQLDFSKEKLEHLLDLGNYILASDMPGELCDRFIETYNSLDKSFDKSKLSLPISVQKREAGISLMRVLQKEEEQSNYKKLNKDGLEYLLNSLQRNMDYLVDALDENIWSNYMNYYKFAYLYKKIQATLWNLTTSIIEYTEDLIEEKETEKLLHALAIGKECLLELNLIREKSNSLDELDTNDCYRLHREFSDSVIKYLVMNFKNKASNGKRI